MAWFVLQSIITFDAAPQATLPFLCLLWVEMALDQNLYRNLLLGSPLKICLYPSNLIKVQLVKHCIRCLILAKNCISLTYVTITNIYFLLGTTRSIHSNQAGFYCAGLLPCFLLVSPWYRYLSHSPNLSCLLDWKLFVAGAVTYHLSAQWFSIITFSPDWHLGGITKQEWTVIIAYLSPFM